MREDMKAAVLRHNLYHALYSALHNARMANKKLPKPEASASPYHPAYGLPDDTRERAIRIAKEKGVNAAITECNVARSTIYRWLSDYASSANAK